MHAIGTKQVRESAAVSDCTKISCVRKVGEARIRKLSAYEIFWIYRSSNEGFCNGWTLAFTKSFLWWNVSLAKMYFLHSYIQRFWKWNNFCWPVENEKEERAIFQPTAAALSQPDCQDVNRSDRSPLFKRIGSVTERLTSRRSGWLGALAVDSSSTLSSFSCSKSQRKGLGAVASKSFERKQGVSSSLW